MLFIFLVFKWFSGWFKIKKLVFKSIILENISLVFFLLEVIFIFLNIELFEKSILFKKFFILWFEIFLVFLVELYGGYLVS